ncbi:thiamine diphosphokinase [Rhodobacterales bacterium HKCCE2091]|nr:thiamine diphosphokinase [Rhodobacterales bacterium HKCCE2091]
MCRRTCRRKRSGSCLRSASGHLFTWTRRRRNLTSHRFVSHIDSRQRRRELGHKVKFDREGGDNGSNPAAIVHAATFVTLLGGGELEPADLDTALARAPTLVAVDGGAGAALALGHRPDAVIGDLDSVTPEDLAQIPSQLVHRIAEQDSTDFEKALRSVAAPGAIAVGFTGRRIDHELAVYHALAADGAPRVLVLGREYVVFHAPGAVSLDLAAGTRVSLFPIRPVSGRSEGLRWPINGLDFAPGVKIGTSNEATGPVRLDFDGPGMLVILPRSGIDAALAALGWRAG